MDRWRGNVAFRRIVQQHRARYQGMHRNARRAVAEDVVNAVIDNGGRFIEATTTTKSRHNCHYVVVSWTKALDKASQALREISHRQRQRIARKKLPLLSSLSVKRYHSTVPSNSSNNSISTFSEQLSQVDSDQESLLHQRIVFGTVSEDDCSSRHEANHTPIAILEDGNGPDWTAPGTVDESSLPLAAWIPPFVEVALTAQASLESSTVVHTRADVADVAATTTATCPSLPQLAKAAALGSGLSQAHVNPLLDNDCLLEQCGAQSSSSSSVGPAADSLDYDHSHEHASVDTKDSEDEESSVGTIDFDPLHAWLSLLNYDSSLSTTTTE
jgi:hypothetical protein